MLSPMSPMYSDFPYDGHVFPVARTRAATRSPLRARHPSGRTRTSAGRSPESLCAHSNPAYVRLAPRPESSWICGSVSAPVRTGALALRAGVVASGTDEDRLRPRPPASIAHAAKARSTAARRRMWRGIRLVAPNAHARCRRRSRRRATRRARPRGRRRPRATRVLGAHDREHPEAEVEDVLHLVVARRRRRAGSRRRSAARPMCPRATTASQRSGSTRARLPGMPPPVTCANACTSTVAGAASASRARRSRSAGAARRRASGARPATRARRGRGRRGRGAQRARASSRCSAGPGSRSRRCGRRRARRCGSTSAALDDADREADEVELTRLHAGRDAPTSRRRAARTARCAAAVGDAGDDLVDLLGHEPADRDVVEEEQRLGALHRDVVDRHRDAVDADRVAAVREPGDQRLRADAVGRRHEQRIAVPLPVDARTARRSRRCRRRPRAGTSSARAP